MCATLAFATALLKVNRGISIINLYDAVPTFIKNTQYREHFLTIYTRMIQSSDKVIFNSNTSECIDGIFRTLDVQKAALSFFRYNAHVDMLLPKREDGLHLVIIGGMADPLRDTRYMLKTLLHQKIHIHNYVMNSATQELIDSLNEQEKPYYHQHDTITDQSKLICEISQYHAGWIMDNGFAVLDMIANIKEPKIKNLFLLFRLTTVSSSLLAIACAGLPMFVNRMVQGIYKEFPHEFFIPIEEAEISDLSPLMKKAMNQTLPDLRTCFSIDQNITKLAGFLEGKA